MSMKNARKEWKALVFIGLLFILLFLGGPLILFGVPHLGGFLFSIHPLVYLIVIGALPVTWCIFALWFGLKVDRPVVDKVDEPEIPKDGIQ